ncbi:hypothetical protein GCM10018952_69180 [Streptosporangium vulgare]
MASLAAIFAIGKPVALDASAEERETRGFISMTTMRPVRGSTANWMLQPPVSTPTSRMTAMATSRMFWYSRSVSVSAGATVTLSPVCTPIGSMFSIEQTITTLSARSAHDLQLVLLPAEDGLLQEHLGGRRGVEARPGDAAQSLLVVREARADPAHGEGGAHHQRVAQLAGGGQALVHGVADERARRLGVEAALGGDLGHDALEQLAVLARLDGVDVGADQLDLVALQDPGLVQGDRGVERGLPAQGGQQRVGPLLGDDLLDDVGGDGLDVGGVGELGVGHDRRRVAVDEDHAEALGAQHAAGLGARVVELAGLADHDRP